jgi:hypothetical protein
VNLVVDEIQIYPHGVQNGETETTIQLMQKSYEETNPVDSEQSRLST